MRPAAVQKIFSNEAAPEKDTYKASRGKKTGILCDKSISI